MGATYGRWQSDNPLKLSSSERSRITVDYTIADISAETLVDVAKILANATAHMSPDEVNRCFPKPYSRQYIDAALSVCTQLGLATQKGLVFGGGEQLRDDLKRATKEQLYLPFQSSLKDFPPFLLFIDFASKGYTSSESAARVRGILGVKGSLENIEKSLRRWGVYARLIAYDKNTGNVEVKVRIEKLTAEYVMKLLKALEAELKTKMFLIDMLGAETYAYLDQRGIKLDDLTASLLSFEVDSKGSASKSTQTLELFLSRLGKDVGANVDSCNGVIELANALRSNDSILNNHTHLLHGLGALRNMSHHGTDKETGQPWTITKQGALISTLLTSSTIRSLFLYYSMKGQEF